MKWIPASSGLASAASPIVAPEPVDDVDDAVREAGLAQDLQRVVRRERRRRRRLPDDRIAHQRCRAGEVAADRGEVERADREDETLERPVLHPVPDTGGGDGLLRVDPKHELDVVAPEVDQLGGRVDLGLMRGLRLVQHRRGDERRAPRAREQLGRAEEDGCALLPREARPVGMRVAGGVDRLLDVLGAALGDVGEDMLLAVWHHRRGRLLRLDLLAADHHRDREPLALHLRQPDAQLLTLGRAGRVTADGLVGRRRRSEDAGSAHEVDCRVGADARDAASLRDRRLGSGGAVDRRRRRRGRARPADARRQVRGRDARNAPQGHPGCPY